MTGRAWELALAAGLAGLSLASLCLGLWGTYRGRRARRLPRVPAPPHRDALRPPPLGPPLYAPPARAHCPQATTDTLPGSLRPPPSQPATTIAAVKGDDFDRLLESERAALQRRNEKP